jgi:hypothetical protein
VPLTRCCHLLLKDSASHNLTLESYFAGSRPPMWGLIVSRISTVRVPKSKNIPAIVIIGWTW